MQHPAEGFIREPRDPKGWIIFLTLFAAGVMFFIGAIVLQTAESIRP